MTVRVFSLCRRENRNKNQGFKTENSEKTESLALSFSRSATAPSRREPLFVRVFFFVSRRKQGGNLRLKNQSPHFFLLRHRSAATVAFLREEGVTHERDGRSPRD